MSKLSENVEVRLKAAQQLLKKDKQKGMQSPNFIRILITFRKQSLITNLLHSQTQIHSQMLTELMANNNVKIIEIKRIIRKRLSMQDSDSIQLFCRKKLITNLHTTIKQLRLENDEGPIEIQVTKMQVF